MSLTYLLVVLLYVVQAYLGIDMRGVYCGVCEHSIPAKELMQ